ncbi:hypothetical protein JOD54_004357 [Actinokineospora baliensis]|nr:hypothetical protein [Actinokineospora baliensis]MBM7774153.1 hypothetical protein [Actinokineospora baliensis]
MPDPVTHAAANETRIANRILGLLTGIHLAPEHAIGSRVSHPAVLARGR